MAKISSSAASPETTEGPKIIVLGDKAKAQLSRSLGKNVAASFNQVGKDVPTFADASAIADKIVASGIKFDKVSPVSWSFFALCVDEWTRARADLFFSFFFFLAFPSPFSQVNIIYNAFVSAISFESKILEVFSEQALRDAANFNAYEQEDDTTRDLAEFALANAIYAALVEGHAAEINSKQNAMDNASKNAGEMINTLGMAYNRGRQAQITNELIDIITGASAL